MLKGAVLNNDLNFQLEYFNCVVLPWSESIDKDILALREKIGTKRKLYIKFSVFRDSQLLEKFPEALPVESTGKGTREFLCPTLQQLRSFQLEKISQSLKLEIDGIFLDNATYPTVWDLTAPDLLDTCYCSRCLEMFEAYIEEPVEGVTLEDKVLAIDGLYYQEWLDFKTSHITTFVKDVRSLLNSSQKGMELVFMSVPWEHHEYGSGIKRLLGVDYDSIKDYVDVLAPMFFANSVLEDLPVIKKKIDYFWTFGKPLLPIISADIVNNVEGFEILKDLIKNPTVLGLFIQQAEKLSTTGIHLFSLE